MKVLIACEYSGRVRDAFIARGHEAISCDLLPTDALGPHYQGDVFDLFKWKSDRLDLSDGSVWFPVNYGENPFGFDLVIAHPPCTDLAVSGARHFAAKIADGRQQAALDFVQKLMDFPVEKIAIENPISVISSKIRKPDQIIQPWQFGHGETKATCLWLKNLPLLKPTDVVAGRENRIHKMPPSADRWKKRSTTYLGIASAMAKQWG